MSAQKLDAAVRAARDALWGCAVTAAALGNGRVERACDEARWAVNEFVETQGEQP